MKKKKQFFIITADHSGIPLALRLQDEGYSVALLMVKPELAEGKKVMPKDAEEARRFKKRTKYLKKNGNGLIRKLWIDEVWSSLKSLDKRSTYFVFDQIYGWQYGEALRKEGFKVLGGTKIGYTLETNRDATLKLFKKLGIDVPLMKKFGPNSVDEGIKFLQKVGDEMLFVLKSDNPRVVTEVAQDSNEELIQKLQAEKAEINKDGFILQQKVEGIEAAVETWFCNGVPVLSNIDLEAKRKYNEMCEVQVGCFDEETEILTKEGWKYFKDLRGDELVYSLDPTTGVAGWYPTAAKWEYDYEGPMYRFHSSDVDLLVTPDHRFVGLGNYKGKKVWMFRQAWELSKTFKVPIRSLWRGGKADYFVLPAYSNEHNLDAPALAIDMKTWVAFLGLYLSEGYVIHEPDKSTAGRVGICQRKRDPEIEEVLSKLPFKWRRQPNQWTTHSVQLASYLRQFGRCYDKYIPEEIKNLDREFLDVLFYYLIKGDGVKRKGGFYAYYTTSKRLADDVAEVAIKLGFGVSIRKREGRPWQIRNRSGVSGEIYEVSCFSKETFRWLGSCKQYVPYFKGKVYDVTVYPHHTILVRRNGKIIWSGNCSFDLLWVLPVDHPLCLRANGPFDEFAANKIKTGLLDLSFIYDHKEDKLWALECCGNRFAYNATYTLLTLLKVPVGEFLSTLLDGGFKRDIGRELFQPLYGTSLRIFNDGESPDQPVHFDDSIKPYVWLWDVYKKGSKLLTTGDESVGVLTALGENPEGSFARLREMFFKIRLPTKWARDDFDEEDEPALPLARYHALKRLKVV